MKTRKKKDKEEIKKPGTVKLFRVGGELMLELEGIDAEVWLRGQHYGHISPDKSWTIKWVITMEENGVPSPTWRAAIHDEEVSE